MKGIKKISIIALGLAFTFGIASCQKKPSDDTMDGKNANDGVVSADPGSVSIAENYPDLEVDLNREDANYELQNITVDTTNANTTLYLGEQFHCEGLVVKATYSLYDTAGNQILDEKGNGINKTQQVYDYSIDSSDVDTSVIGTYYATVRYRYGKIIRTRQILISVSSSKLETTKNLVYPAGITATYEFASTPAGVEKFDSHVVTVKQGTTFKFDKSKLKYKLYTNTVSRTGQSYKTAVSDLSVTDVVVDDSKVDCNQRGTYLIPVTYTANDSLGESHTVKTFVIVDVINPIKSIALKSGTRAIGASIYDVDPNKLNWVVRVVPTVGSGYDEKWSDDKFALEGVDIFNWSDSQTVTIRSKEYPDVTGTTTIKINPSETQDIKAYYDLVPKITKIGTDSLPEEITLAETNFIYGPLPKSINGAPYYTSGATYVNGRSGKDAYGSIAFDNRISIKGLTQTIKVVMDKPGQILVFFAGQSDEESELTMYSSDEDGRMDEEVGTGVTGSTKQIITKHIFNCELPGTYYFAAPGAGLYIHGFIIAKAL